MRLASSAFALATVSLLAGACTALEGDGTGEDSAELSIAFKKKCPSWTCQVYSPRFPRSWEDLEFHELSTHLFEENDEGVSIESFELAPTSPSSPHQSLRVVGDEISFIGSAGAVPTDDLDRVRLRLRTHGGDRFEVRIAEHREVLDFVTTPYYHKVPLYRFVYKAHGTTDWQPLCEEQGGNDPDWSSIPAGWAVAFAGDRYHATSNRVIESDVDGRWFNIACTGSPIAKMLLLRHTHNWVGTPNETSLPQRQAVYRMFRGDYCGGSHSFFDPDKRLLYMDRQGWRGDFDPLSDDVRIESVWHADGAVCLNTPRLNGDPDLMDELMDSCNDELPPPCNAMMLRSWAQRGYAISATPAPAR